MSRRAPVVFSKRRGTLEVDICAVPDWDGFDKLIQFLKNFYMVEVRESYDGPDARRWVLHAEGVTFELHHDDPYGNTLVASANDASEGLVGRIGADLKERLAGLIETDI